MRGHMARLPGYRYVHVVYEPAPDDPKHDLKCGNECPCEPKSMGIGSDTILVIHDPQDGIVLLEDDARARGFDDNPFRPR